MRWTSLVVFALGITGCKGDEPIDTGPPDEPPFEYDLSTQARVLSASVELPQSAVDAHAAVTTLMSVSLMAAAEPYVQNVMGHPAAPDEFCWKLSNEQYTTFDIQYSSCKNIIATDGSLRVRQVLEGYKAFEFLGLNVNGRKLGGALGFDGTGAPPLSFTTYDTLADDPAPDSRSPVGININGAMYSINWDGGMALDPEGGRFRSWGVGEIGSLAGLTTVRVGGTDADELTSATAPADALSGSLNYADCRCPDDGVMAYELPIDVVNIIVDLDDLQPVDDGVDDPQLDMDVLGTVQGEFVVDTTGCGEYALDVTLSESTVLVPVSGLIVGAAIQKQCDALLINDDEKCAALVGLASRTETFQFEVDSDIVAEGANIDALARFGGSWCRF